MKAPKTINIAHGITSKKLVHLLQNYEVLLLKRKKKTFKIQQDFIQIFQNNALTLDQIPTHLPNGRQGIQNIELSDLQKFTLIKNDTISVGKLKISLDKNLLQLNLQYPTRHHEQTQFVNRSRVGGHKIR